MSTYIALLRGINVSGQKLIKMADLRVHLSELDIENVQTYIQSGNIAFESQKKSASTLEKMIKGKIKEKYGFDVPTLVKTQAELIQAMANIPFVKELAEEPKKLYITFLADEPSQERIEKLVEKDLSPEKYVLRGKVLYFYAANGAANSKVGNNLFENKLKVAATSRNLNTVNKLIEMAGDK